MTVYYCYILQSETSGRFYIGQSEDVRKRLERHNEGGVRSTKGRGPWRLVYANCHSDRSSAYKEEQKLKGFKSRKRLIEKIKMGGFDPGPARLDILDVLEVRGST